LPDDQESYVHRIGRTGRAGKDGLAISLISNSEVRRVQYLTQKFKLEIKPIEVPGVQAIVAKQHEKAMTLLNTTSTELVTKNEYINQLFAQVSECSKEALAIAFTNSLYEKYLQHAVPAKNMDIPSFNQTSSRNTTDGIALQEFFMNIGSDDGIEKSDIINYLISSEKITHDDIKKIKVLRRHTFVVVPEQQAQPALDALQGKSLNGLRVRINITNEVPELGNGRRGGERRESRGSRGSSYGSGYERSGRGSSRRSFGGSSRGSSRGGSRAYQG
jgi:ATP-dependent RNA helicase DeaD